MAGAGGALDPPRRPDRGAGAGPASSARWTRSRRPARRSWRRSRGSARPSRRALREWFAVDWHREVVRKWARGRGTDGRGAGRDGPAPAGGPDRRGDRDAVGVLPGPGGRGGAGPGRQGHRLGVEEDRLRGGRREPGLQGRQGGRAAGAHPRRGRLRGRCWPRARRRPAGWPSVTISD